MKKTIDKKKESQTKLLSFLSSAKKNTCSAIVVKYYRMNDYSSLDTDKDYIYSAN